MGDNRDMHVGWVVHQVSQILMENEEPNETPGLEVGTWANDKGYHITLTRVNQRTGYGKRIAVPLEEVPSLVAAMLKEVVDFAERVEALQRGGA